MKITKYAKGLKFTYIYTVLLVMFVGILALVDYPQYVPTEIVNGTIYHMVINGQEVGTVKDIEQAQQWLWEARKEVASEIAKENVEENDGVTGVFGCDYRIYQ